MISPTASAPAYLEVDKTKMQGKLVSMPTRDQIPVKLNDQLVVEYYSR
jgi:small subunit ribosomal protein S4